MIQITQVSLPSEQVDRLERDAKSMGLSLSGSLAFLGQRRFGRLDHRAREATQFAFSTQGDSLRKLAE